jgi:hypothetical protein
VPSAEQVDNRRRGRAEDRIPQIAQDGMGPVDVAPLTQSRAGRTVRYRNAHASLMTVENSEISDGAVDVELVDQSNLDQLGPKSRTALGVMRELPNCPTGAPLSPTLRPGAPKELGRDERWRFDDYSAG